MAPLIATSVIFSYVIYTVGVVAPRALILYSIDSISIVFYCFY